MHDHDISLPPFPHDPDPAMGVCVADGYGIRIQVRNRHLVVADGFGSHRRERRFHKATSGLRSLVVIGHTGYLTFEALRWLTDAGVGYLQLDGDGTVLATTTTQGLNKATLRRAQALAATNPAGIEITRRILTRKVDGQARVAQTLGRPAIADTIQSHIGQLAQAAALDTLRLAEAQAAALYWQAWSNEPVRFVQAHRARIPAHWTRFGARSSPITSNPRRAANPANALLNYLYALLEAETILACHTIGLDPGIGILHTDQDARPSLALDLMEAARPEVDSYLLDLLRGHVFRAGDFHETRRGVCRILPPLTHHLAHTTTAWANAIAPIAEDVARELLDPPSAGSALPTLLTQRNRSRGRAEVRRRSSTRTVSPETPPANCRDCGLTVERGRQRCLDCNQAFQAQRVAQLYREAVATVAELRKTGADPLHGGEAAQRRGRQVEAQNALSRAWDRDNERPDPSVFAGEILPHLADISLGDLQAATGLSLGYCSLIRRGLKTPHPRHWEALRAL
jgi:CRISPR-associated protein Cas1